MNILVMHLNHKQHQLNTETYLPRLLKTL